MNTKKPFYKRWWFISLVALFAIGLVVPTPEDSAEEAKATTEKRELKNITVHSEVAEKEAEAEKERVKEKEDKAKAQAAKEAREAEEKAAKVAQEKDAYITTIKVAAEDALFDFDNNADSIFKPTLDGLSDGSTNAVDGMHKLRVFRSNYEVLYKQVQAIEFEKAKSTKQGREDLEAFRDELSQAITSRQLAADTLIKALGEGEVLPKDVDLALAHINDANNALTRAVLALSALDAKYAE